MELSGASLFRTTVTWTASHSQRRSCIEPAIFAEKAEINEDAFRKIGDLVRKKQLNLQFLCEERSEFHRNQHCEQFSAAGKRVWLRHALVGPTKTLSTDLAPIGGDIEPMMCTVKMSKWETMKTKSHLGTRGSQSKNESQEFHVSRETRT